MSKLIVIRYIRSKKRVIRLFAISVQMYAFCTSAYSVRFARFSIQEKKRDYHLNVIQQRFGHLRGDRKFDRPRSEPNLNIRFTIWHLASYKPYRCVLES